MTTIDPSRPVYADHIKDASDKPIPLRVLSETAVREYVRGKWYDNPVLLCKDLEGKIIYVGKHLIYQE